MATAAKAAGAFRTIGEVSRDTGVAQHVLRYWEGRFPQLKPLTRAGNRRYYRPADVALVRRIADLLDRQGYTIRGVQQLLTEEGHGGASPAPPPSAPLPPLSASAETLPVLGILREHLAQALAADDLALANPNLLA